MLGWIVSGPKTEIGRLIHRRARGIRTDIVTIVKGCSSQMTDDQTDIPNIAEILAGVLRSIEPKLQPFLLAKLERLAAQRYRMWASDHPDQSVKEGLLACADREEQIATRVESLEPNATAIQDNLLSDHPELLDLNPRRG